MIYKFTEFSPFLSNLSFRLSAHLRNHILPRFDNEISETPGEGPNQGGKGCTGIVGSEKQSLLRLLHD